MGTQNTWEETLPVSSILVFSFPHAWQLKPYSTKSMARVEQLRCLSCPRFSSILFTRTSSESCVHARSGDAVKKAPNWIHTNVAARSFCTSWQCKRKWRTKTWSFWQDDRMCNAALIVLHQSTTSLLRRPGAFTINKRRFLSFFTRSWPPALELIPWFFTKFPFLWNSKHPYLLVFWWEVKEITFAGSATCLVLSLDGKSENGVESCNSHRHSVQDQFCKLVA